MDQSGPLLVLNTDSESCRLTWQKLHQDRSSLVLPRYTISELLQTGLFHGTLLIETVTVVIIIVIIKILRVIFWLF